MFDHNCYSEQKCSFVYFINDVIFLYFSHDDSRTRGEHNDPRRGQDQTMCTGKVSKTFHIKFPYILHYMSFGANWE